MQNLYMMAALIREQEMRKMATEISTGKINVEQAMINYNVATKEAVIQRVEDYKIEINNASTQHESSFSNVTIQAA